MLGWQLIIRRGAKRAPFDDSVNEQRVASWRAALGGTRWLDDLVESGHALDLGGNGYPCRYVVAVGTLLEMLQSGTPRSEGASVIGDDYVLPGTWTGDEDIALELLYAADPLELLVVEAWDQS
ncbi:MAG: hypothetical protein RBS22_06355 [Spongiibacteraceae bacterium]|nr:hypothetical protein [Spongiibacteraceae bacterium]